LPLALNASAIVISKGYQAAGVAQSNYLLAYTAEGMPRDVQAEFDQVRQALHGSGAPDPLEVEAPTGTDIWTEMLGDDKTLQVRVGVANKDLPVYIQDQAEILNTGSFIADISGGIIHALKGPANLPDASTWLSALRKPALAAEGYVVVADAPAVLQTRLDRWGYQPQGLDLMKALKERWDPQGILNPGSFVGGI